MNTQIIWENHKTTSDICGIFKENEIFTIKKRSSKKSESYDLISWMLKNNTFPITTSSKVLGSFDTPDFAKLEAEKLWNDFIQLLTE